jgi:hypothetical protein
MQSISCHEVSTFISTLKRIIGSLPAYVLAGTLNFKPPALQIGGDSFAILLALPG